MPLTADLSSPLRLSSNLPFATLALALLLVPAPCTQAQTLTVASATTGLEVVPIVNYYVGTSFTTASGGPFDDLAFNLYSDSGATTPLAVGTGFLLSESYSGSPSDLSSGTPGYIASVAASGNQYTFASGVTLQANTQYWFYENAPDPEIIGAPSATSVADYASGANHSFTAYPGQLGFEVTGELSAVPEPSSYVLITSLLALAAGAVFVHRRTGKLDLV